jgi:hypothetical protein
MLIGLRNSMFSGKRGWVNPYVTQDLLCLYFGKDYDGEKILPRVGNAPAIYVHSSSTGTLVKTANGLKADGGYVVLRSATVPDIVSIFRDFSNGVNNAVSWELTSDYTGITGYPSTEYDKCLLAFQTNDSQSSGGNLQWVQTRLNRTANTANRYFAVTGVGSFLSSALTLNFSGSSTATKYTPETLGFYISSADGGVLNRHLFGYTGAYSTQKSGTFTFRSYSNDTRNRFIEGAYINMMILNGVEFNRLACWNKKLTDAEFSQNTAADAVEFGFAA